MPNPYGGYQTSSIPGFKNSNGQTVPGQSGPVSGPVTPSDDLLVANGALPSQQALPTATGLNWVQLDLSQVNNRISIDVQNNGPNDVEIWPNTSNPAFGGGWLIKSGGFFSFPWTEAIKTYAVIAGGGSCDLRVIQEVKN